MAMVIRYIRGPPSAQGSTNPSVKGTGFGSEKEQLALQKNESGKD